MEMLVRETLEVVDLEIIDPENGVDFAQDFLETEDRRFFEYSDDWEEDVPGFVAKEGESDCGYIISRETADWWLERLPLWQTIYNLENDLDWKTLEELSHPGWDADPEGLRAYIDALRQMVEEAEEEEEEE